jgi:serine protein kinase
MARKNFLDIIKSQRQEKKEEKFNGTFIDYLNLVSENPNVIKLAHKDFTSQF